MHKDESGVTEFCQHTRKRSGLRRRVNKGVRRNVKAELKRMTPSNAELLKLADRFPPPPEWYEDVLQQDD